MRLQARATTSISRRRSPLMCALSRCSSIRKRVSETGLSGNGDMATPRRYGKPPLWCGSRAPASPARKKGERGRRYFPARGTRSGYHVRGKYLRPLFSRPREPQDRDSGRRTRRLLSSPARIGAPPGGHPNPRNPVNPSLLPALLLAMGIASAACAAPVPPPELAAAQLRAINHRFVEASIHPDNAYMEALSGEDFLALTTSGACDGRTAFLAGMRRPARYQGAAYPE